MFPLLVNERLIPELPDVMKAYKRAATVRDMSDELHKHEPSRVVHIPIIPQRGIRHVTTFVTTNILFVEIFQYLCMYQNPRVLSGIH
jgi:hypothetical protein